MFVVHAAGDHVSDDARVSQRQLCCLPRGNVPPQLRDTNLIPGAAGPLLTAGQQEEGGAHSGQHKAQNWLR